MRWTLCRAIVTGSALLLTHCAALPAVTASHVQYGGTMNLLQITVAGSVDQETAPAALASFAASVTRCQNYAVVVTSIVTHSTPAAGSDAAPMVTSTVGGALTCASL